MQTIQCCEAFATLPNGTLVKFFTVEVVQPSQTAVIYNFSAPPILHIVHAQVGEMKDTLEAMTISIVQIPLEHYPFAVSSPQPSSTDMGTRKPGDKTTTFAIGTLLWATETQ